jgi:hypothetical protein
LTDRVGTERVQDEEKGDEKNPLSTLKLSMKGDTGGGIRTREALKLASLSGWCLKPLGHPSAGTTDSIYVTQNEHGEGKRARFNSRALLRAAARVDRRRSSAAIVRSGRSEK